MSNAKRMNEFKYIILDYLYRTRNRSCNRAKIFFATNTDRQYAAIFNKAFSSICKTDFVVFDGEKASWNNEYFISVIHKEKTCESVYRETEKFFVTYENLFPIDDDIVIVKITDEKRRLCEAIKILKRTNKHITGILVQQGCATFVIPDDKKRYKYDLFVHASLVSDIPNYSKVEVIIEPFDIGLKPVCRINRVIRNSIEHNEKNRRYILAKYGFNERFSDKAIKQASEIKTRLSYTVRSNRVELESQAFIIKSDRYSDLAYSAQKKKDGFIITIYIPDIANKIVENSALDCEAREKGLSCDLYDYESTLFPKDLLFNKLLFNEGKKSPAIAYQLKFDINGNRTDFSVFETIVEPIKTVFADELVKYLQLRNEDLEDVYYPIIDELFAFIELYDVINKDPLVFNPMKAIVTSDNKVESNKNVVNDLVYLLNNECEKITSDIFAFSNFPIIHQYYELPNMFLIERLFNHCSHLQEKPLCLLEEKIKASDIVNYVKDIDCDTATAIVSNINSIIKPVKYSKEIMYNLKAGTCTCPIMYPTRNYAALYNQRLLKRFINKSLFNDNIEENVIKGIGKLCEDLNYRELSKVNAEKEYLNIMVVDKIISEGMTFTALVYSFSPSGVNVVLQNGLQGLVRFDDYELSDKEFKFTHKDEEKSLLIGDSIVISLDYYDVQRDRLIFQYIG